MFGVPFILQVPREGMDYDRLYQLIVERIKRCLKPAPAEKEQALSEARSISPSSDSAMEDVEPSPLDAENGNDVRPMETNGLESSFTPSSPPRLFTMDMVNQSGNTSLVKLKPNGKPISFNGTFGFM